MNAMLPPVMAGPQAVPGVLSATAFGLVGLATLVYYVLGIRRGFRERRTTIPVLVVVTNVSWEFVFSVVHPLAGPMRAVVLLWLPLNLVLAYQAVRYGRRDFAGLSRAAFAGMVLGWLAFSLSFMMLLTREFGDTDATYSQVFVALFMEAMFVVLLRQRRSTAGQTMYFAVLKTIVDLAGGIALISRYPDRWLLYQFVAAELVFDAVYFVALRRTFLAEGRRPWRKI
jgi:hypothetical protein